MKSTSTRVPLKVGEFSNLLYNFRVIRFYFRNPKGKVVTAYKSKTKEGRKKERKKERKEVTKEGRKEVIEEENRLVVRQDGLETLLKEGGRGQRR